MRLYWMVLAYGICSFICTRGSDGNLPAFIILFAVLGIIYVGLLPTTFNNHQTLHTIGHLITFNCVAIFSALIRSRLDEMAGMLLWLIPIAVSLPIIIGAIILSIVHHPSRRKGFDVVPCETIEPPANNSDE